MACKTEKGAKIKELVEAYLEINPDGDYKGFLDSGVTRGLRYDRSQVKAVFNQTKLLNSENWVNKTLERSFGLQLLLDWIDADGAIFLLENALKSIGIDIKVDTNVYGTKALYKSRARNLEAEILKFITGDKKGDINLAKASEQSWAKRVTRETGLSVEEFMLYVMAKHAIERNLRGGEIYKDKRDNKISYYLDKLKNAKTQKKKDKWKRKLNKVFKENTPPLRKSGWASTRADKLELIRRGTVDADATPVAQDILDMDIYSGKEAAIEPLYKEFYDNVIKPGIDIREDQGLISSEIADELRSGTRKTSEIGTTFTKFNWYLPLQVDKNFLDSTNKSMSQLVSGKGLTSLTAGEGFVMSKRYDPLPTSVYMAKSNSALAGRNLSIARLANIFEETPDPAVTIKGVRVSHTVSPDGSSYITSSDVNRLDQNNSLTFFVDGKMKSIEFTPMDGVPVHPIVQAYNKLPAMSNRMSNGWFNRWVRVATNFFRKIFTNRNPFFPPVNFVRDLLTSQINLTSIGREFDVDNLRAKHLKNVRKFLTRHFKDKSSESRAELERLIDLAEEHGMPIHFSEYNNRLKGTISDYNENFSSAKVDEQIRNTGTVEANASKYWNSAGRVLDNYSDFFEDVNRLALFKTLIDAGVDPEIAAFQSREITLNFERKGNRLGLLSTYYLFINAGIQDVFRGSKAFIGFDNTRVNVGGGKSIPIPDKVGVKAASAMVMLGIVTRVMSRLAMDDEDEDIFQDKFKSENYIIIPSPFKKGSSITIPKPYTIFRAPFTLGEYIADVLLDKKEFSAVTAFGVFSNSLMRATDPIGATDNATNLSPFLLRPIVQGALNTNWAGGNIVPTYMKSPDYKGVLYEKHFSTTPEYAKEMSKAAFKVGFGNTYKNTMLTPLGIDYMMNQYLFSGVVGDLDRLSTMAFKKESTGDDFKNSLELITHGLLTEDKAVKKPIEDVIERFDPFRTIQRNPIPLFRRFVTRQSEQKYKRGVLLRDILYNTKQNELSEHDYNFVKRALGEVTWSQRSITRYINSFENNFKKAIEKYGPLKSGRSRSKTRGTGTKPTRSRTRKGD